MQFDHIITLRKLLRSPGDTELQDNRSYTPLNVATEEEGFLAIIQTLIDAAAKLPAVEEPVGSGKEGDGDEAHFSTPLILDYTKLATPLQLAAKWGHVEALRMLLGHSAY